MTLFSFGLKLTALKPENTGIFFIHQFNLKLLFNGLTLMKGGVLRGNFK